MKREIKFRAWDKESSQMIYATDGNLSDFFFDFTSERNLRLFTRPSEDHEGEYPEERDQEMMQYTCLKDKNGKEIYEGDIMEWVTQRSVVEWDDYGCFSIAFQASAGSEVLTEILGNYAKYSLVIGNIYENPELLEDV